jgi:hypothetical protein
VIDTSVAEALVCNTPSVVLLPVRSSTTRAKHDLKMTFDHYSGGLLPRS